MKLKLKKRKISSLNISHMLKGGDTDTGSGAYTDNPSGQPTNGATCNPTEEVTCTYTLDVTCNTNDATLKTCTDPNTPGSNGFGTRSVRC